LDKAPIPSTFDTQRCTPHRCLLPEAGCLLQRSSVGNLLAGGTWRSGLGTRCHRSRTGPLLPALRQLWRRPTSAFYVVTISGPDDENIPHAYGVDEITCSSIRPLAYQFWFPVPFLEWVSSQGVPGHFCLSAEGLPSVHSCRLRLRPCLRVNLLGISHVAPEDDEVWNPKAASCATATPRKLSFVAR
jgi:hypothetical protein